MCERVRIKKIAGVLLVYSPTLKRHLFVFMNDWNWIMSSVQVQVEKKPVFSESKTVANRIQLKNGCVHIFKSSNNLYILWLTWRSTVSLVNKYLK